VTTQPQPPTGTGAGDDRAADQRTAAGDAQGDGVATAAADLAPDTTLRADGGSAEVVPLRPPRPGLRTGGRSAPRDRRRAPASRARRPDGPPDPERLARLLVHLTAEVAAGRRPVAQLEPLLAPTLLRRLAARLRPGIERPQRPPVIRRIVVAPPTPSGAVEATVLLEDDGRVRALALRLEQHRGLWRATELTAPDSGYRPLPTRSDPRQQRGPDAFDEAEAEADADAVTRRRGTA
jgi:hypothetical protein